MANRRADLAAALASSAGSTRRVPEPPAALASAPESSPRRQGRAGEPASRIGTVPITVHHPEAVRDQLKIMAVELKRPMHDLVAEALNDPASRSFCCD